MYAIVSIHDVMPQTLDRVCAIVDRLPSPCLENLIMLVVPGHDWQPNQIDVLRDFQSRGIKLAGHGWTHETSGIRGFYHRLHSLLISRTAAEHLSLDASAIEALMRRNHEWFSAHHLTAPNLYVPPAWALGPISEEGLERTPWRYLETTSGFIDITTRERRGLPLVGFEADTRLRQFLLFVINWLNEKLASESRPLRISIHPFDYDYFLSAQLERVVGKVSRNVDYVDIF